MSPVSRAGLVSEISSRNFFLRKSFQRVHIRSRAITEISVFATETYVTGDENFPIWTLQSR